MNNMRILIFGLPRCGTTSLLNFLIKSLPNYYIWQNEPYQHEIETISGENIIIKTVLCNFILLRENETLEENSFQLIKNFDKVIYIRRKNIENIKKSFADMIYKRELKYHGFNVIYSDCEKQSNDFIDEWLSVFDIVSNNKKVYFYEDIFRNEPTEYLIDILSDLNLNFNKTAFMKHIHTKNKEIEENWDKIKKIKTVI